MTKEQSTGPLPVDDGPLNAMLMGGTAVIHREAERVPFMVAFFKGELPKDAYTEYLGRLFHVYDALEQAAEELAPNATVGWVHTPELYRLEGLATDLEFYAGPDWRARMTPTPAAKAYADRVREAAESAPHTYVAHHWLRYLGYVLGQDILRKLVRKAYDVGDDGMAFYDFPKIDDPKAYLGRYHGWMNGMPLSNEQKLEVIAEGYRAFQCQIDLTSELAADFGVGDATEEETDQLLGDLKAEHP